MKMRVSIVLFAFLFLTPSLKAADDINEQLLRMSLSNALVSPDSEEWQAASIKLDEYYSRYEQCLLSKVMDVHKFNATMKWSEVLPVLTEIDAKLFGPNATLSYWQVEQNINKSVQYYKELRAKKKNEENKKEFERKEKLALEDKKKFDQEFLRLKQHLARNAIEADETHADVQKLLSRIWFLSDNFGFLPANHMINDRESAIDFMMASIRTNIFEGGGCYPGYAGRLALNYLIILHAKVCSLNSVGF